MRLSIATSVRSRTPPRLPGAGVTMGWTCETSRPWPGPEAHRVSGWCCSAAPVRGAGTAGPHLVEALVLDGLRRVLRRGRHDDGGHDDRLDARAQWTTSVRQRPRQRSARDHDRGNWGTE